MPSLRAWGQGSGAPAHRQLVQRPLPQSVRKGDHAGVPNLVVIEVKQLHNAHETKLLRQESVHAKSQGMGTRQWGASTPSSGPRPPSHLGQA